MGNLEYTLNFNCGQQRCLLSIITVIFILHPLLVYCNTFLIINIIKTKKSIAECTKIQMMLIIAFLNTLSPDTIAVELTVALATKHRMQCMQKVRHKSRTLGVYYIDLRP